MGQRVLLYRSFRGFSCYFSTLSTRDVLISFGAWSLLTEDVSVLTYITRTWPKVFVSAKIPQSVMGVVPLLFHLNFSDSDLKRNVSTVVLKGYFYVGVSLCSLSLLFLVRGLFIVWMPAMYFSSAGRYPLGRWCDWYFGDQSLYCMCSRPFSCLCGCYSPVWGGSTPQLWE